MLTTIKSLGFLYALEESANWALLSSFCDGSNLHISVSSNYFPHVR